MDELRGRLRIGLHRDAEVTDGAGNDPTTVSQAFCSALPVACTRVAPSCWETFASLVLQAAYEATIWAAADNAQRGASDMVLLTSLGGGAFGNDERWIYDAMARGLKLASNIALDVRIVSYGAPSAALLQMAKAFE